jgi:NAD(P)H-dependent FMN reductase
MIKIAIIIGSTRPGRNGGAVAKWVNPQEASVNAMLDQLIAWGGALKTLRKT